MTPATDWPTALVAACRGTGVSAAYQPIVDVAHGYTAGYEALARFDDPNRLGPERWFAAARAHGVHADLEAAALRAALGSRADLPGNTFLTVNVSPDLLATEQIRAVWRDQATSVGWSSS